MKENTKKVQINGRIVDIDKRITREDRRVVVITVEVKGGGVVQAMSSDSIWAKYNEEDINEQQRKMVYFRKKLTNLCWDLFIGDYVKFNTLEWFDGVLTRYDIVSLLEASGIPID